jgi:hypothetical protein
VPADPRAPVCEVEPQPPTFRVERVATQSRFVEGLEVALPPTLVGRAETDVAHPASAEEMGGILIASWHEAVPPSPGDQGPELQIAVWVGPEDGYPTVGADTASRQLFARQCRLRTTGGERFVVEYALHGQHRTHEYLSAFWRVAPERYLRVSITGRDASRRAEARAIIGSMRAITPDR